MYKKNIGFFGESLAENFLKKRGYIITGRNVFIGHCEIDIIAKFKNKTIFVEVKTRTNLNYGSAREAISQQKIKHLKKAINFFVKRNKLSPEAVRVDFIAIDINKKKKMANIKHIKNILF